MKCVHVCACACVCVCVCVLYTVNMCSEVHGVGINFSNEYM